MRLKKEALSSPIEANLPPRLIYQIERDSGILSAYHD